MRTAASFPSPAMRRNRYNEWIMCLKGTGGDEDACKGVRQMAHSICPDEWIQGWDEQREEGSFAGIKLGGEAEAEH